MSPDGLRPAGRPRHWPGNWIRALLLAPWVLLVPCSCGKHQNLPIPEDKLIPILSDVHIAEAALEGLAGEEKDSMAAKYYREIFAIHHVEQADFDSSLAILMSDPERFGSVYEKVEAYLEKMRTDLGETKIPDDYQ